MIGFNFSEALLTGTSPLEIIVRGTIVYLSIFLMLRLVLKRQSSTVSTNDLLVLVLIADAAQNAMAGQYQSIMDGVILVGTIIFWSFFIDWLGYRFKFIARLIEPPPLLLVQNGALLRHNMRKELVTKDELLSQLRQQGIEDIAQVKEAYMEPDGNFSVVSTGQCSRDKKDSRQRKS
jgi:uncharacterized membrane protein YcaP (DUF421 family)